MEQHFLAIDLGAGSGRAILGTLTDAGVELREVHRFANKPVTLGDTLYWDLPALLRETIEGIRKAALETGGRLDGISVDSWGVDFCLFDRTGQPLGLPVHYRDARTSGLLDEVFSILPDSELFATTGVRSLELNTLYQLVALQKRTPEVVSAADTMLLIADTIHFFLCGRLAQEETLASSTQLWDPRTHTWADTIIERLELPRHLFPEVVPPATVLAPLKPELVQQTGLLAPPQVIASASHDTALAVAAAPASEATSWAYLSSGTWSLLGVERLAPELTESSRERHFTNEVGVGGTITLLTMINGLFLLEECRRRWAAEGVDLDHDALLHAAQQSDASLIWPDDPSLFSPEDAPEAIRLFCRRTGQNVPTTPGAVTRTILESLALTYRRGLDAVEVVTGQSIDRLHIVGGGSQNELLNQFTADALGLPTSAGPSEATALGNVLVQALAAGSLGSLEEVRALARASSNVTEALPRNADVWSAKQERFRQLEKTARAGE